AFAVSMSLNFIGFPVGSAIGGAVAPISLELAFLEALTLTMIAAVLAFALIPKEHDEPVVRQVASAGHQYRRPDGQRASRRSRRRSPRSSVSGTCTASLSADTGTAMD